MVAVRSPEDRRQFVNGPFAYLSQVLIDITLLGGGMVALKDRYEAMDTLETIAAERIIDLFLVEPQLFELMDHPGLESADLSSLRTLTYIGASAPPTLRLRAHRRFGPRVVHTYGASEEGLVSVLSPAEADPANAERFHSAGRILPHVEVRLRRDDGTIAGAGETGSIEVRSPAMALGYRNRPDLEATAFQDGWYRSGDLGRINADGYLHILGRAVDIAMIDGRMVSPTLIEETLCRLPEIRYAAVVVDQDQARRVAVVIPWPGMTIDHAACLGAVAAELARRWRDRCCCCRAWPYRSPGRASPTGRRFAPWGGLTRRPKTNDATRRGHGRSPSLRAQRSNPFLYEMVGQRVPKTVRIVNVSMTCGVGGREAWPNRRAPAAEPWIASLRSQ